MTPSSSDGSPLLLAHSYYLRYDEKQTRKMKPYAPLGTLITAGSIRRRGHSVELFDAMLSEGVDDFVAKLDRVRPAVVGILEDNFNFLTKMCTLRMRRAAFDMIRAARDRGCLVAVNGSDAIDRPHLYLEAGAHAVILGEVEETFVELAEAWLARPGEEPDGILGLALPRPSAKGSGAPRLRLTGMRPRLDDLDALPFPAWDLVDVERYRTAWTEAHGRLSWNMVTSRGCPFGCNWCAKPVFGRRYSQRSPADAAEELRRLKQHVAPDHVWFADDIFGLTPAWIEVFAEEVTRRGARTPFTIQSRVNLMQPRAVDALRAAGAEEVWMGVESGSQQVLDAMDKGTRLEDVGPATRTLKDRGIRACWFVQLGYPGEDLEGIRGTRDLILSERPDEIGVSVSYPLPGTPFYETVRSQVGRKRNWEDTDDLDVLFQGAYTADFYRRVRDLLHAEVDAYRNGGGGPNGAWGELMEREAEFRNPAVDVG